MKKYEEAQELAVAIKPSRDWTEVTEECKRLAWLAGMGKEYAEADGDSFEAVIEAAAAKLGVEIF